MLSSSPRTAAQPRWQRSGEPAVPPPVGLGRPVNRGQSPLDKHSRTHARAWRFGGPESLTPREGASPVLLKEMNDFVFELDLLGKEFLRMANSVSTKFMT